MTLRPVARATICICMLVLGGLAGGSAPAVAAGTGGATYGVTTGPPAAPSPPAGPPAAPPARPLQDGTQTQAIVAQAVSTLSTHSLRPGSTGRLVHALQSLLQLAGLNVIVSGRYDGTTTHAVRRFQSRHRMKATGIADPPTTTALATAATGAAADAPPDAGWIFPLTPVGNVGQRDEGTAA
ncbi:MAG: peptidoglycan-binding domain-containing protein, partial [Solirubrobacteraceae bacterium]